MSVALLFSVCFFKMSVANYVFMPLVVVTLVISFQVDEENIIETVLCRQCGHEVTNASNIKDVATKMAKRQRNDTVLGRKHTLIQLLENPAGNQFEVITVKSGHIHEMGESVEDYSWFPGFAWKIILCPKCGVHLGWSFHPLDNNDDDSYSFLGLILSRILHSSYIDSIVVTPKAYQS